MTEHERRIDKRATWLFVNTLRTKIRGLGRVVDRAGLYALSRHYGLSSHLLDFTGDPAVAIWFACSDSTTTARDARVLAIDAKSFTRLGGRTIAPPPFEGRMAAQIAVSLDARGYRTNVLGQQMLSTVFPVPRRECPFTLFRDGELVQLLGGSEWLARLAPHCRAYALAAVDEPMTRRSFGETLRLCADAYTAAPEDMVFLTDAHLVQWMTRFIDWLHWIAIGVSLEETTNTVDLEVLSPIIMSNPTIASLSAEYTKRVALKGIVPGAERITEMIRGAVLDSLPSRYRQRQANMVVISPAQQKRFLDHIGAIRNEIPDPSTYRKPRFG